MNQRINQSIDVSTNEWINQPINRSINQLSDRSIIGQPGSEKSSVQKSGAQSLGSSLIIKIKSDKYISIAHVEVAVFYPKLVAKSNMIAVIPADAQTTLFTTLMVRDRVKYRNKS